MSRFVFIFGLLVALCDGGFAQEPPLPAKQASPSERPDLDIPEIPIEPPVLSPAPSPTTPTSATQLSPMPKTVDLSQLDAVFKATSLGKPADDLRVRVESRKLENAAVIDPKVIAAKSDIKGARTDLERRRRYKIYYDLYYSKMRDIATTPDMKVYVDQLRASHLAMLAQPRVRPTPTPSPSATPAKP